MGSVARHQLVTQFNEPDEGPPLPEASQGRMPANLFQDEEHGPTRGELSALSCDDLHRLASLLSEQGCHRRAGALLEGYRLELLLRVMSPDPGDRTAAKSSPAIPDQPMLLRHYLPPQPTGNDERSAWNVSQCMWQLSPG